MGRETWRERIALPAGTGTTDSESWTAMRAYSVVAQLSSMGVLIATLSACGYDDSGHLQTTLQPLEHQDDEDGCDPVSGPEL